MVLMRYAANTGHYNHYHLLSGQDLPIQRQETIQNFFTKNSDKEFVGFDKDVFTYGDRVYYRYILQELAGKKKILRKVDKVLLGVQKILKIKRNQGIRFQKGANWFSITDDFVRYVIDKEDWIKKVFNYGYCVDEVFLQTIMLNSDYMDKLYYNKSDGTHRNTMRYIDWSSGRPHIFHEGDLDILKQSDLMFARKFDSDVDERIIREIYELYKD